MKHTMGDLKQMQSMPLDIKIEMTKLRIEAWIQEYGYDGVYVSFSGGKDSTVLLDIARQIYPDMLAVFVDTGLEYPEIREFVKTFDDVEWLKPKKNFKQVINDYGYPFISKEVSDKIDYARKYLEAVRKYNAVEHRPQNEQGKCSLSESKMRSIPRETVRYKQVMGTFLNKNGKKSLYDFSKWRFLLHAPFNVSAQCCSVMKKSPAHSFQKKTGRNPITAQLANESRVRTNKWLQYGCNGFNMKQPISNPMSFWTEQDILLYIKKYGNEMMQRKIENLERHYECSLEEIVDSKTGLQKFRRDDFTPICSVYGEVAESKDGTLTTTGCDRTGCMFCAYGCHLEKQGNGRFLKMKETHPKQYEYIMKPIEQGGLGYKEIIDWINEHGGFNIEY